MTSRRKLALAGGIGGLGLLALLGLVFGTSSGVRGYLDDHYRRAGTEAGGSRVYTSPASPARVAAAISGARKPAERINDPGGYFLRYQNNIVAVTNDGTGGSRIHLDDEGRGYARWYPYVGGRWGTFSGPAEGFRGGGPGAGK